MSNHPSSAPLEDDPCDVIAKAMHGHRLSAEHLAKQSGLSIETIQHSLNESEAPLNDSQIEAVALALELSPSALADLPNYQPSVSPPKELMQIVTPFGHAGVNAFILRHGSSASIFDTGTDASPILHYLQQESLELDAIYITHRHHDHTGGLDAFSKTTTHFADDFVNGQEITLFPGIQLKALETSGHFTPSLAYLITGLDTPLCICGDIIFAGSMGKTPNPERYQQSLRHARNNIMSLPPSTIICPGHGPLTTVEQEARHNPFLSLSPPPSASSVPAHT